MTEEGEVRGSSRTSFPLDLAGVVFDGKNLPAAEQTTTAECYVKVQMDEGYVATLSAFKIFMQYFPDIANYEDLLVLQGSNDDFATTPNEILKIDSSLHEGWNYYDLSQNPPTFSHYRLQSMKPSTGGCDNIGEIQFIGRELINSSSSTETCKVQILENGVTNDAAILTDVSYDSAGTPTVTGIAPRFGSVEGGETVTITGTNFGSGNNPTVKFDGIECVV